MLGFRRLFSAFWYMFAHQRLFFLLSERLDKLIPVRMGDGKYPECIGSRVERLYWQCRGLQYDVERTVTEANTFRKNYDALHKARFEERTEYAKTIKELHEHVQALSEDLAAAKELISNLERRQAPMPVTNWNFCQQSVQPPPPDFPFPGFAAWQNTFACTPHLDGNTYYWHAPKNFCHDTPRANLSDAIFDALKANGYCESSPGVIGFRGFDDANSQRLALSALENALRRLKVIP